SSAVAAMLAEVSITIAVVAGSRSHTSGRGSPSARQTSASSSSWISHDNSRRSLRHSRRLSLSRVTCSHSAANGTITCRLRIRSRYSSVITPAPAAKITARSASTNPAKFMSDSCGSPQHPAESEDPQHQIIEGLVDRRAKERHPPRPTLVLQRRTKALVGLGVRFQERGAERDVAALIAL